MVSARIVAISGSPSPRSRTDAVLSRAVSRLVNRGHDVTGLVLRDLDPGALLAGGRDDPGIAAALAQISDADAIVVATPVYQAAYAGLLKVFLDLLSPPVLRGKLVLPLATGGTAANVLMLDHALRPVLEAIGADHVLRGRTVPSADLTTAADGSRVLTPEAAASVAKVVDEFADRLDVAVEQRRQRANQRSIVVVGAGPRALGLVDRLGANLVGDGRGLVVHVVDPHTAGAGRIWRNDQSRLLWMNSMASDVTVFTDCSVTCEGPLTTGPSLDEWVSGAGRARLQALGWPVETYDHASYLPRGVLSEYLAWAWTQVRAQLPEGVSLRVHDDQVVDITDLPCPDAAAGGAARQLVTLAGGATLDADVVMLAQGHLDQEPTAQEQALAQAAAGQGVTYLPPAYTADLDVSALAPGEPVVVRGLGLAFVDLMVLLSQGRGGRFTGEGDDLTYHPSGDEPVLLAGSSRGVPYHAKLGYSLGRDPVPLQVMTADRLQRAVGPDGTIDGDAQLWPLVAAELTAAHYRHLFSHHPDRAHGDWDELQDLLMTEGEASPTFRAAMERAVPDPRDRFDLAQVDRPLAGRRFAGPDQLQEAVVEHVRDDLARRADPYWSMDRAVFDTGLSVHAALSYLAAQGLLTRHDHTAIVNGRFRSLFSFLASGPPPRRLAELLALHRAGVVRFLGPDLTVHLDGGEVVATSPAVPGQVRAKALVDAFLPLTRLADVADPLTAGLLRRGEISGDDLLVTDAASRVVRADGSVHPRLYAAGVTVAGSAGSAGFHRPRFNGPALDRKSVV